MSNDVIIKVENLSKQYRIGTKEASYKTIRESIVDTAKAPFAGIGSTLRNLTNKTNLTNKPNEANQTDLFWALKDISFEVKRGEVVGIIGRNGAGKSTLLKILSKITEPTEGRVELRGRVGSLLEVGTGFHPELTGHENIYLYGAILGMDRWEVNRKFDEIVAFAELDKFIDTPVKRYSSGMYMRLAFAVAAHLEPEILLIDEVLAVGDMEFQKKCIGKMEDVSKQGRTVLFVSHNMSAISNLCDKGILLNKGEIQQTGSVKAIVDTYLNESLHLDGNVIFPDNRVSSTNKLQFLSIRILDKDRNQTSQIDLLDGFFIEINYNISKSIRGAQIVFELWNATGSCVLCSTDFDKNPKDINIVKSPGTYTSSCFISSNYLRGGRYWIELASSVPGVEALDKINNAIALEVIDTGSAELKLSQKRRGIISPVLLWDTHRTAL